MLLMMRKHPDAKIILDNGGPSEVAKLLGYDPKDGGAQRVQNWIYRGVPAEVKLEHPELFLNKKLVPVSEASK